MKRITTFTIDNNEFDGRFSDQLTFNSSFINYSDLSEEELCHWRNIFLKMRTRMNDEICRRRNKVLDEIDELTKEDGSKES